jgi:hypothetical protein
MRKTMKKPNNCKKRAVVIITAMAAAFLLGRIAIGETDDWRTYLLVPPFFIAALLFSHTSAHSWRWPLAVAMAGITLVAIDRAVIAPARVPGHHGYSAAMRLLRSAADEPFYGNHDTAATAARDFSGAIQRICTTIFSTDSGERQESTNFPTFCQDGPDRIVFLCRIPGMARYRDAEVRELLADIAWKLADARTEPLDPNGHKELVVSLTGNFATSITMRGSTGGPPPGILKHPLNTRDIYPAFQISNP